MDQKMAYCLGEFLGVFILVFFGCSSVAVAVLFDAFSGLWQVAVVWGLAVTPAIYATRSLSCAHLNPAVTVGMVLAGRMERSRFLWYVGSQLAGGIAAGTALLLVFGSAVSGFEAAEGITRGSEQSVRTAMIFGEYFPNPGMKAEWFDVSMATAFAVECLGAFVLMTMIFLLTEGCNVGRPSEGASPMFIGATVAMLIAVLAPLTQCGINPARDFGPRLVAFFAGWGPMAIPGPKGGFFLVYILGPI
ncbi:MIP/aquaporin family protein, partial [Thermodesulfobacteriota bacterium]